MSDNAGVYWTDPAGVYKQPEVFNPPAFQNANNARHAIWHFGRMLELLVYTSDNADWRADNADLVDDGRYERGAPLVVSVRGVWQPNTQKRGRGMIDAVEGSRSEGNFVLHLDSHDPVNIAAAAAHPTVFPNGIRLVDADDRGTDGIYNFPMAIQFRGNRYKIKQPMAFFEGGDEELHNEGAIYRADCQLWHDRYHEREARGDAPVWGPGA